MFAVNHVEGPVRSNKMIIPFLLFVILFCSSSLQACTTFFINRDNAILLAKNLDWPLADGIILVNIKGETKYSFSGDHQSFQWQARYSSITFNQFGKEFPLGGINEKGLVVEEMSYSPSRYPPVGEKCVNEFQWIQYQLDNFSTVSQVVENIDRISIDPVIAKLHYMICDRQGHVAIIEFIDGEIQCYVDNDVIIPVLTNNSYSNALNYAKHHQGFGGTRMVSDGPESPERFVRAATLINDIHAVPGEPLHDDAFDILNAVSQDDTQWSIVYDVASGSIYFRTRQNVFIHQIELADVDLESLKMFNLCMNDMENQSLRFDDYTVEENLQLIQSVLEKLVTLDELSKDRAGQLFESFRNYYKLSMNP